MQPNIITSGRKYLDIDAYAGIIAYRELQHVLGNNQALAISTAPLNQSIPPMIQDLSYGLDSRENLPSERKIAVIDVSNPEFFDTFVQLDEVVEVIDHHSGYEKFWAERLGDKAEIEHIGSVCTLIFERFCRFDKLEVLNQALCKLLVAGILDNTLNLLSNITTERDRAAYHKLLQIGNIPQNWGEEYFQACFAGIKSNLAQAIANDLKIEQVSPWLPQVFGQIILPSYRDLNEKVLEACFTNYDVWMMNVISLLDGKGYIYSSDTETTKKLAKLLKAPAQNNVIILEKPMLRKEIMKLARETPFTL